MRPNSASVAAVAAATDSFSVTSQATDVQGKGW
jgi:hypothetical protein